MKYIYALIIVLLTSANALGSLYSIRQKLHDKEVMCQNWDIGQDSKGIIYVANRNGLVCYDGKTWQTYTTNENRTIRSLYISPDDRIYIGSYEEFGYFERNEYGKLVYTSISGLFQHKELKNKDIWSIEQDENLIYFQSFAGYFSFDTQSKKIAFYPVKNMMQRLYKVNNQIYAVIQDELYLLEKNNLTKLPTSSAPFQSPVRSILPYEGNRLLIQTENQGFWIYDQGKYIPQSTINKTPDIIAITKLFMRRTAICWQEHAVTACSVSFRKVTCFTNWIIGTSCSTIPSCHSLKTRPTISGSDWRRDFHSPLSMILSLSTT